MEKVEFSVWFLLSHPREGGGGEDANLYLISALQNEIQIEFQV